MKDDLNYHINSNYWEKWNKLLPNKFDLSKFNNIKLRIFNHFYTDFYVHENLYVINMKEKPSLGYKQINECKFNSEGVILFSLKHNNTIYYIKILGFYYTQTHVVFCGPPHAKTLINSYNKDKTGTIRKLNQIVGNLKSSIALIDCAKELIDATN